MPYDTGKMAQYTLELVENEVRAVPVSGEFVFVEVDGKWRVIGAVE